MRRARGLPWEGAAEYERLFVSGEMLALAGLPCWRFEQVREERDARVAEPDPGLGSAD